MSKREAYQKALEQLKAETLTDIVKFSLKDTSPSIFESKVGGTPYIPKDKDIPKDSFGRQLRFLAQIDCGNLKALPDFPHSGLLQFFISDSDIWGLDEKDGFKVYYYENPDRTVTEEECKVKIISDDSEEVYMPVDGEYAMEFAPDKMSMTEWDFRYDSLAKSKLEGEIDQDLFDEIFYDYEEDDDYDEDDEEEYDGDDEENDDDYCEHRLGGYPYFTQSDPRHEGSDKTVLLFQLDSDYHDGEDIVMWGDSGICNFFISPEDLKKRDFSKVLYNWDCC